jgi:hypothetical protein
VHQPAIVGVEHRAPVLPVRGGSLGGGAGTVRRQRPVPLEPQPVRPADQCTVGTGALIRDGAALGGSYYVSNPGGATVEERLTFLPYQIRMNKAARDSLAAAMAL